MVQILALTKFQPDRTVGSHIFNLQGIVQSNREALYSQVLSSYPKLAAYAASDASRPFYTAPCVPDPSPGQSQSSICFQNEQSVWHPFVLARQTL